VGNTEAHLKLVKMKVLRIKKRKDIPLKIREISEKKHKIMLEMLDNDDRYGRIIGIKEYRNSKTIIILDLSVWRGNETSNE